MRIENDAIVLDSRYDSANAGDFDKDLNKHVELLSDYIKDNGKVVLDAKELEYISSAGLRVLLALRKKFEKVDIENLSRDVYDIFQLTGFDTLFNIKRAFREITVNEDVEVGHGLSSQVFRIDRDTVVKIYNQRVPFHKIEKEIEFAKIAFLFDIPTIISYDLVKVNGKYGTIFEMVDSYVLSRYLNAHPEEFDAYKEKYKSMLRSCHETVVDDKFQDIKPLWHKWVDMLAPWLSEEELDKCHKMVAAVSDCNNFVHSDIHVNNVMTRDGELVLIDMADIGRGHKIFDIGPLCFHYKYFDIYDKDMADNLIVLSIDMRKKLYDMLMEEYIYDENPEKHAILKNIYDTFGALRTGILAAKHSQMEDSRKAGFIEVMRQNLFYRIDEITELIPEYL